MPKKRAIQPKCHFGLDHSQVCLYTAVRRHIILAMIALTICSVTASTMRDKTSTLPPEPTSPDDEPPDPGLITLTVAEVKRLFNLVIRTWRQHSCRPRPLYRFEPQVHRRP